MFYFFPGDGTDRCNWPKSRPGKKGVFSILRASKLNGFSPNALRMLGRFVTLYRKLDFLTAEPGMVNEKRYTRSVFALPPCSAMNVLGTRGSFLGSLNRSFNDSPE